MGIASGLQWFPDVNERTITRHTQHIEVGLGRCRDADEVRRANRNSADGRQS